MYENEIIYIKNAIKNAMDKELDKNKNSVNSNTSMKPTIPDVNLFINSMNNSVFEKVIFQDREDGRVNNFYYQTVFENWAITRIEEFTSSNQFGERTKWMRLFIKMYCEHLNRITIKIATGAHFNFKNKPKWDSNYTGGFLDLFHFLDYSSGYNNTIDSLLMTLKLNWNEDPIRATKMQSYCIDRIKEMKRMVEVNYFIKKDNPIFIYYDEIIERIEKSIDIELTKVLLKEKKQQTPKTDSEKVKFVLAIIGDNKWNATSPVFHHIKGVLSQNQISSKEARNIMLDLKGMHSPDVNRNVVEPIIEYLERIDFDIPNDSYLKNEEESQHPKHDPNMWNVECYNLFKYLFENYYKKTKRQITNIWFYLKEVEVDKYVFIATKDVYSDFIKTNYQIELKNWDKAPLKYAEKDLGTMNNHRINYEDSLK
ncbi:hypothetical protein D9V96_008285 [Zobellia laminariae]|uniref:hypothetical protein n=1 Tax=Zobellia laminariae TaxID=248906 RepID=UPI0016A4F449|nr:hypothetical protein [Zobellia laminariae]